MARILEQLNQDHGNVSRLLDVMDIEHGRVLRGEAFDAPLLGSIMRYLTQYQDVFHHPREDLVFARILVRSPDTFGQIEALEAQHRELADHGDRLYRAARASRRDAPDDALERLLGAYNVALREHMNTESTGVFPLARIILSRTDWLGIDERFEVASDPLFGPQVERAYQVVFEHNAARRATAG